MKDYKRLTDSEYAKSCKENGLTGYYIRLAELEDKIEDGTLIELPCKVGQECWYASKYTGIEAGKVKHLKISEYGWYIFTTILKNLYFKEYEIGDTLFFDKAEAEKRLEELKKSNEK